MIFNQVKTISMDFQIVKKYASKQDKTIEIKTIQLKSKGFWLDCVI